MEIELNFYTHVKNTNQIPAIVQDGIVFSDGVTVYNNDFVKIGKLCLIWVVAFTL